METFENPSHRQVHPPNYTLQGNTLIPRNGDENGNGGPTSNPNIRILGIEATQGMQFYNFNGQGTGTGADNSLALVPRKTTVFRVYADVSAQSPGFPIPSSISGALSVFRFNWPQAPHYVMAGAAPLAPLASPIAAKPSSAIQRALALDTLNFRLDGSLAEPGNTGQIAVSAAAFPSTSPSNSPKRGDERVLEVKGKRR